MIAGALPGCAVSSYSYQVQRWRLPVPQNAITSRGFTQPVPVEKDPDLASGKGLGSAASYGEAMSAPDSIVSGGM